MEFIVEKIKDLAVKSNTVVVAIDGRSGSGKSSLAQKLLEQLPGSKVVHLDVFDLYERESNIQKVVDEVLKQSGDGITIVEGIFALSQKLTPYYDLKIWIECPKEVGFKRGLQRDIDLNGVDNSEKWLNYWLPKEDAYIASENPRLKAELVVNG